MNRFVLFFVFIISLFPSGAFSAQIVSDFRGNFKAEVLEVVSQSNENIAGTDTEKINQNIFAQILTGPQKDKTINIDNDYIELEKGDRFYFNHYFYQDIGDKYIITNIDRHQSLFWVFVLFIIAILAFGGLQGFRSLVALTGSFLAIFYILLPGLLNGWNPILTSFLVSTCILFVAIFFTHGFNKESFVAFLGTIISVLITSVFAFFAVYGTNLSGFSAEEAVYLNFNTSGSLDFTALLLGAIIIGMLGVLDDIAVTQSAVVAELYGTKKNISRREVYKRAMRVGKEHVGALVNTLFLAYAGASLPLLMYFYVSDANLGSAINSEIFATEIVRAVSGSVGLILTVPIVTILAVIYLKGYKSKHEHSHHHH